MLITDIPKHCIRTYTGKIFSYENPEVCIEDIAHGLANTCRFGGQIKHFYSVADHSVCVARFVKPHLRLQALLHDAHEAYLPDVPSPIKDLLPDYRRIAGLIQRAVCKKFSVDYELHPEVKEADRIMLHQEWTLWNEDISSQNSEQNFLNYFYAITYQGKNRG